MRIKATNMENVQSDEQFIRLQDVLRSHLASAKWKTIIRSVIVICLLTGCNQSENNQKKDGFYDYSQTLDLYRIPLIEPYQIISADRGYSWMFERGGLSNVVNKVGIEDSVIVLYSSRTALVDGMSQAWFVLKAGSKEEKVFKTEEDYNKYLRFIGIDSIRIYEVNQVFTEFDKTKRLPPEWSK
jgi:hypothetical protein